MECMSSQRNGHVFPGTPTAVAAPALNGRNHGAATGASDASPMISTRCEAASSCLPSSSGRQGARARVWRKV